VRVEDISAKHLAMADRSMIPIGDEIQIMSAIKTSGHGAWFQKTPLRVLTLAFRYHEGEMAEWMRGADRVSCVEAGREDLQSGRVEKAAWWGQGLEGMTPGDGVRFSQRRAKARTGRRDGPCCCMGDWGGNVPIIGQ
jgi:hypothetical protein